MADRMRLVRAEDLALDLDVKAGWRTPVALLAARERMAAALGVSDEEAVEALAVTIESALGSDTNWWQALSAAKAVLGGVDGG